MYLCIYSPIIGIDYYYQKGVNNYRLTRASGFDSEASKNINKIAFSGIDTYLQNLNAYYVFKHKKFSYSAAYSQSGQQKRSAGSFILGFNYARTMRYFILPQAFTNVVPALGNEFITLLKETSISGYIAINDLTKIGDVIRSRTYDAFMPLVTVALVYLLLVFIFARLWGVLEGRLRRNG